MFKPIFSIAMISALALNSCGGEKKEEDKKDKEKSEGTSQIDPSLQKDVSANRLADISISGMVSEVKCVGSVKKLLSAMMGVTEIEIDFDSASDVNHAMVKYDNSIINDQQMVSAIEKLNDGAYKVGEVEVKKIEEKPTVSRKKSEEKEVTFTPSSSGSGFALPNILDVFNIL